MRSTGESRGASSSLFIAVFTPWATEREPEAVGRAIERLLG
jgi:hypothetical protein